MIENIQICLEWLKTIFQKLDQKWPRVAKIVCMQIDKPTIYILPIWQLDIQVLHKTTAFNQK